MSPDEVAHLPCASAKPSPLGETRARCIKTNTFQNIAGDFLTDRNTYLPQIIRANILSGIVHIIMSCMRCPELIQFTPIRGTLYHHMGVSCNTHVLALIHIVTKSKTTQLVNIYFYVYIRLYM